MKEKLVKISGGLAIMFSVFLLLATAKQVVNKNTVSTKIANPPVQNINNRIEPDLSETIVKGTFNLKTPGNVIRSYDLKNEILYHYKAIISSKLKNENIHPVLKLETSTDNKITWVEVPWSWIDYNQGTLYFHFKTVENGIEHLADNFTGRYQLILE